MNLDLSNINKVAAITFYGRSGSVFFQSLLDSHPNIITIPGTYVMGFNDFWILEASNSSKEDIIIKFINRYDVLFNAKSHVPIYGSGENAGIELGFDSMGSQRNEAISIDRQRFFAHLNRILVGTSTPSRKDFFKAIHIAYFYALHDRYNSDYEPIIIFQLHTPAQSRAIQLLKDFPETIYLNTVREPVQTFSSHLKMGLNSGSLTHDNVLYCLRHALTGGTPIFEELRHQSWAIKLEDLHNRPEKILSAVCKVLDIPWHQALMSSTFNGKLWWNVRVSEQVNGFTDKIISKKNDEVLTNFDRFRLEVLFSEKNKAWDYPPFPWHDYILMRQMLEYPFKFENLIQSQGNGEKIETRRKIRDMVSGFWEELNFGDQSSRQEIQLLRPL